MEANILTARQLKWKNMMMCSLIMHQEASTNRPKLQEMLKWIRKGDVVEVHSIDRLARNINDLLQIVKIITEERHAEIFFTKKICVLQMMKQSI